VCLSGAPTICIPVVVRSLLVARRVFNQFSARRLAYDRVGTPALCGTRRELRLPFGARAPNDSYSSTLVPTQSPETLVFGVNRTAKMTISSHS